MVAFGDVRRVGCLERKINNPVTTGSGRETSIHVSKRRGAIFFFFKNSPN